MYTAYQPVAVLGSFFLTSGCVAQHFQVAFISLPVKSPTICLYLSPSLVIPRALVRAVLSFP